MLRINNVITETTLLFIALAFFGMLHAQKTTNFTFNHGALSVKYVDQYATFYNEVLQLQEIKNETKINL